MRSMYDSSSASAHGAHGRAELRLTVVREQQVLQQHGLFLGNTELARSVRDLLRPHDQMAEELPGRGILRHDAEIGERKLPLLAEVVQQCAGQQQAAVNDLRIQAREEIRRAQHVVSMHQKGRTKNCGAHSSRPGCAGMRQRCRVSIVSATLR